MKPKTEEFLNFLLWSAELLTRPSFRNVSESYEAWAYRKGFFRQTVPLEKQGFLERTGKDPKDRLYRLTEKGRLQALGGRDPQTLWHRHWDGSWRLVIFDVPKAQNAQRNRLREYLRGRGFGCLQGSVWITPDPVVQEREVLATGIINVNSLILFKAQPCAGESDSEIVAGAWDFDKINQRYEEHIQLLEQCPKSRLTDEPAAKALQRWAAAEREAWLGAVWKDPLLPGRLLPECYLGKQAWNKRTEVLRDAGRRLREFTG